VVDGAHNHYEVFGGTLSKHMRFAAMWVMKIFSFGSRVGGDDIVGVSCCLDTYVGVWQVVVRPDVEELRLATADRSSLPKKREQARPM
jgi:hypothetical protein